MTSNIYLTDRELDSVLVGLRLLQEFATVGSVPSFLSAEKAEQLEANRFEHGPALTVPEIDVLCRRLNGGAA